MTCKSLQAKRIFIFTCLSNINRLSVIIHYHFITSLNYLPQSESERVFDAVNLGRGKLGALKENNYEFGAWDPVESGKSGATASTASKQGSKVSEPPVAEARSGQTFEDYFPLITAAAANAANPPQPPPPSSAAALKGEPVAEPRSGELVLEQNREERDCELCWI